ncbi:MAG: hypothetical protein KF716_32475 [Anaerolineae bacterium]|nr:hypothetical protein [Anaerolineae bacterium]
MDHLFILATIVFTAYGQLVMKWQASQLGTLPADTPGRIQYVIHLLLNPWIISVLVSALLGMFSWMGALSRFRLSYAYPFYSLTFVVVFLASAVLFHESITLNKSIGMILLVAGIIFIGQG